MRSMYKLMHEEKTNFKKINLDAAKQLGDLLLEARIASGEELASIAKNLTLSKKQVSGVELLQFSGFHSSTYYFLAAKKYAHYLKIEFDFETLVNDDEDLIQIPSYDDSSQKSKTIKPSNLIAKIKTPSKKTAVYLTLCLLFLVFIYRAINPQPSENNSQQQDISLEEPTEPKTSEIPPTTTVETDPAEASQAPKNLQIDNSEIRLEFNDTTWTQVIYRDNEKKQKNYLAGETLNLQRSELQGLVIGNINAVKVIASNKELDISAFVTPGSNVIKIFGEKLRSIGN